MRISIFGLGCVGAVTTGHHVLDVNGWTDLKELPAKYEGFCW